jgi:signal transduction histidine kinase
VSGWPRGLRGRLFLSHVVVVVVGALTMVVVGAVVTRAVYEHRLGGYGYGRSQGRGRGNGSGVVDPISEGELVAVLDDSLVPALLAGAAAALVAAAVVAWFLARRLLRPLEEVRHATRRMAAGDYASRVPLPAETELASLAADVNELGEHLAATEQRRSHLLAEVTHELRTPLTVISGTMEGLLDGVIEPSDEVFGSMADEAARLGRLVTDLTTLSRAEEGTLELAVAPCDAAAVASSAAERLRSQFEHDGVELVVTATTDVPVLADTDRLTQIVTNLVGNALGHTPSGGRVDVAVRRAGREAVIEVTDTGSGIDPAALDRIFERVYRGEVRPRHGGAGRGIGLTIARSLARAHGGDLVASSPGPGRGATFSVTLPLAAHP